MPNKRDTPGVMLPPPLFFVLGLLAGAAARNLAPRAGSVLAGQLLCAVSLAIVISAVTVMLRARTPIDPYRPSTGLVTNGPFRFSRNPLYLSMTLLYAGLALLLRLPVALGVLPLVLLALHHGVIVREERYLEGKFGDAYRAYRARVRRWI